MIARIHESMRKEDKGFTLVELLVVIVIIGILIAIAIPAFLKFRENGWKAQVKSDLRNAATAIESYATDNNGDYTTMAGETATEADNSAVAGTKLLIDNGLKVSDGVEIEVATADKDGFCIDGDHDRVGGTGGQFHYDSSTGGVEAGQC